MYVFKPSTVVLSRQLFERMYMYLNIILLVKHFVQMALGVTCIKSSLHLWYYELSSSLYVQRIRPVTPNVCVDAEAHYPRAFWLVLIQCSKLPDTLHNSTISHAELSFLAVSLNSTCQGRSLHWKSISLVNTSIYQVYRLQTRCMYMRAVIKVALLWLDPC